VLHWLKVEIDRLQSELESQSARQQTSAVTSVCGESSVDGDTISQLEDSGQHGIAELWKLIDTLKSELQQATAAERTSHTQLNTVTQVRTFTEKQASTFSRRKIVWGGGGRWRECEGTPAVYMTLWVSHKFPQHDTIMLHALCNCV